MRGDQLLGASLHFHAEIIFDSVQKCKIGINYFMKSGR